MLRSSVIPMLFLSCLKWAHSEPESIARLRTQFTRLETELQEIWTPSLRKDYVTWQARIREEVIWTKLRTTEKDGSVFLFGQVPWEQLTAVRAEPIPQARDVLEVKLRVEGAKQVETLVLNRLPGTSVFISTLPAKVSEGAELGIEADQTKGPVDVTASPVVLKWVDLPLDILRSLRLPPSRRTPELEQSWRRQFKSQSDLLRPRRDELALLRAKLNRELEKTRH